MSQQFTTVPFKGTVGVILSDPPCKDGNARFTDCFISFLVSLLFENKGEIHIN